MKQGKWTERSRRSTGSQLVVRGDGTRVRVSLRPSAGHMTAFKTLSDRVRAEQDVAAGVLSHLISHDPATWTGRLAGWPEAHTPSMMQALAAYGSEEPAASQSHDPLQIIAAAESLASLIGDASGKAEGLMEVWIARARVLQNRGDLAGALAALDRAAGFTAENFTGDLDRADIYWSKARIYGDMEDYEGALVNLLECYRFCHDERSEELRTLFVLFLSEQKTSVRR